MIPTAFDTETFPIGPQQCAPKLVCFSVAQEGKSNLFSASEEGAEEILQAMFEQKDLLIICHNAAYDLAVCANHFPSLVTRIFDALAECRVTDIWIREKLKMLSTHGQLDEATMQATGLDGSLASLAKRHLGLDMSESKKGEDAWRLNYHTLDGMMIEDYPVEAVEYSKLDAEATLGVWHAQNTEPGKTTTEHFQTAVDFALFLQTCWGIAIDEERRDRVLAELTEKLGSEHSQVLVAANILRPAVGPRPHKKNPSKFTRGVPESRNMKMLRTHMEDQAKTRGVELRLTETGEISTDAEAITDALSWCESEVLKAYQAREEISKLVTTEIPRICAPIVHPRYDVLKETGRTSGRGSRKGRLSLYPSVNIQNVDPRIRECYVARPGHLLVSCDYSALELVTLAQKLLDLFGESALATLINQGINPHDFLGSALAYKLDVKFHESIDAAGIRDEMSLFDAYKAMESASDATIRGLYKHFRDLAKPTGLGFPGGLGPETFLSYAKATYGIDLVQMCGGIRQDAIEFARSLRNYWFDTYPEMRSYFRWVTGCTDPNNPEKYSYTSPFGMVRSGASYCAAANGAALQTPAAEGAKLGVLEVSRACYDPCAGSILYGSHPIAFIHDEQILEIPDDGLAHERAMELSRIMVSAMQDVVTKVRVTANPVLMRRWNKDAKQVFDEAGRLQVWPKAEQVSADTRQAS